MKLPLKRVFWLALPAFLLLAVGLAFAFQSRLSCAVAVVWQATGASGVAVGVAASGMGVSGLPGEGADAADFTPGRRGRSCCAVSRELIGPSIATLTV